MNEDQELGLQDSPQLDAEMKAAEALRRFEERQAKDAFTAPPENPEDVMPVKPSDPVAFALHQSQVDQMRTAVLVFMDKAGEIRLQPIGANQNIADIETILTAGTRLMQNNQIIFLVQEALKQSAIAAAQQRAMASVTPIGGKKH